MSGIVISKQSWQRDLFILEKKVKVEFVVQDGNVFFTVKIRPERIQRFVIDIAIQVFLSFLVEPP